MSGAYIIDGVGDEVTITLGVLLAVFIVIVSWLSTRVNDSGFSTEELQRSAPQPNTDTTQSDNVSTDEPSSNRNELNVNQGAASRSSDTSSVFAEESAVSGFSEGASELRQRRGQTSESTQEEHPSQNQNGQQTMTIRLKYMDETSHIVQASPDETLESFRRRNLPAETRSRYRLIYRGQVLRENSRTLRQLNLVGGTTESASSIPVIHCFLSPTAETEGANLGASQRMEMVAEELHIGSLLLPILGVCLICMWYLCVFHTSLFSIQSVVSIVGFTFLYIALVVNHFL